ncbi:MAG: MTH1187 family thiamine-binding protein [Proteobacteria bacterium]|nr:MTH1187 family thiamine-binding protein [Pseudomonadota bacterium]
MKCIVDICIIPIGIGLSVSKEVAECQKIFKKHKIQSQLHAYGTNLEGEWDEVFAAIKECHETLHAQGTLRISSTLKVGTRTDREQSMQDKIDSVQNKLKKI